ncbi:MAG: WXG100 family type VII secretion target [Clostridia bacterium]|nr:WXG100 family type VII secretion target [Clostridia bacterium]
MEYDTAAIRRVARQVGRAASEIRATATSDVSAVINGLSGHFEGEAADALHEELADLSSDLKRLASGLNSVEKELMDYAARLEEADRQAALFIRNNA